MARNVPTTRRVFKTLVGALLMTSVAGAAREGAEGIGAPAMATRANLSFERVDDKHWPVGWVVRERRIAGESRSLLLPEDVSSASAAFATDTAVVHGGARSAVITGDPGERCLIMGAEGFPLIPIRNYLGTDSLRLELKGWVKGQNAGGKVQVALEFSQHSDLQWGWSGTSAAECPGGTYDWTPVKTATTNNTGDWVRIACRAPGNSGRVWFDDCSLTINGVDAFELLEKVREWRDGTTRNARLQARLPGAVIWTEDPAQRVFPWSRPPVDELRPGIELFAARGEYESLQLAIKPLGALAGLTVSFSDLKGPGLIDKANLEAREVGLVNRPDAGDFLDPAGPFPDPLLPRPSYAFPAGASRALWLTLRVPGDAAPGEYSGSVVLGGQVKLGIPVRLTVWDFSMPDRPAFDLVIGFKPKCVALYDKRPWLDAMRDYLPGLAAHRVRGLDTEVWPLPVVTGRELSLSPASVAESDAVADYALSLGFDTLTTANSPFYCGTDAWKSAPWDAKEFDTGIRRDSHDFLRLYSTYLGLTAAHLREKGIMDRVLQYIFDEPFLSAKRAEEMPKINEIYALSKKAGFRNMLTTDPTQEYPNIDVWSPIFYRCLAGMADNRMAQKAGQKVMWYHNGFYRFSRTALNARLVPWFTWRYRLDGYLIWCVNYWTEGNPWEEARLDGDGYLLYPNPRGQGTPCSSIRWELFREGIEDYEYFTILKQRAESVLADSGSIPLRREQAKAALDLLGEMDALIPEDASMLR